jgi:ribosomal protein L7/L12
MLLMDMMDLQERLEAAIGKRDLAAVQMLQTENLSAETRAERGFGALYEAKKYTDAMQCAIELRYRRRLAQDIRDALFDLGS